MWVEVKVQSLTRRLSIIVYTAKSSMYYVCCAKEALKCEHTLHITFSSLFHLQCSPIVVPKVYCPSIEILFRTPCYSVIQDTLLFRTPHYSGHLIIQDTSLFRTPHYSGHLIIQNTLLFRTPHYSGHLIIQDTSLFRTYYYSGQLIIQDA